ncbi:MAG: hypothetical protein R3C10_22580 [Pirellulales bacterium]
MSFKARLVNPMARRAKLAPRFVAYLDDLGRNQPLELVRTGHLVIEALLVELIQLSTPGNVPWSWNFPAKVDHCIAAGLLPSWRKSFYLAINHMRNDFIYVLGHELTYDDVFD